MELAGKIAVVTGGASGIGASTVRMLQEAGATAVSWDLNPAADVHCDVSSLENVKQALATTIEKFGVPTLLVHAAAITARGSILDVDLESWDKAFEINARGTYIVLGTVAKAMVDAEIEEGSIVVLSSTASTLTDAGGAIYGGSKSVVNHLAKTAAVELGKYGIRVNAILPGPTETPLTKRTLSSDEYRQLVIETTPLGKVGTADLLADSIINTLRMDWVTGQIITSDGGTHLITPRSTARAKAAGNFKAGARSEFVADEAKS